MAFVKCKSMDQTVPITSSQDKQGLGATGFASAECELLGCTNNGKASGTPVFLCDKALVRLSPIDSFGLVPKVSRFGNQKMVLLCHPNSPRLLPTAAVWGSWG
jgi:hypothetical protein